MTLRAPLITAVGTRARAADLLTWAQGLPPGVVANPVPPIRNYDWPNPLPLKTDAGINRTWVHVQQLIPPGGSPFGQSDWPNPQPQKPNLELRNWSQGLPPGVIATTLPPRTQDFPNPAPARLNHELRFWWNPAQQAVAVPFGQTDWLLPAQPRANLELRTWWQSPAVPPFVQVPFNQAYWPNPLPTAPNLELRTWFNGLPTGQITQQLPPNAQYDWPNPPPLPPNLELKSWIQTYSDQAPAPIGPSDTHDPLPKRRKRFDDNAQTQVIRESRLRPKKVRKPEVPAQEPAPIDTSAEDEDVSLLLAEEDEQLTSLVELAAHLLRTLH